MADSGIKSYGIQWNWLLSKVVRHLAEKCHFVNDYNEWRKLNTRIKRPPHAKMFQFDPKAILISKMWQLSIFIFIFLDLKNKALVAATVAKILLAHVFKKSDNNSVSRKGFCCGGWWLIEGEECLFNLVKLSNFLKCVCKLDVKKQQHMATLLILMLTISHLSSHSSRTTQGNFLF